MIEIKAVPGKLIMLGKQGENLAREVIFDVSGVRAEFGDGTFRLAAKRPGEADAYPATVTETGDTVVWALTGADTQNAGRGQCELAYYAGETRLKTWTYDTAIAKSLTGSPKTDPYDEFLDEVNRLAAEAAISQREAKNSENAAKKSEENAKASENAAKTSEDNAAEYARAALAAETKSKQNAEYAASAATAAGQYAQNAATSATNAANSASAAETHEKGAKDAATAAAKSAEGLADAVKRAEDAATRAQDNAGKTAADREAVAEMKTAAQTAQGNAEKAATAAAGSATSAGESAAAAETSKTGAAEIKAQIDEIKAGIDTTKGEIDQAKADIDQTKTDTLAAKTAATTAAATATEKAAEIADSAAQIAENTENIGKNATGIETNTTDIDLLRRENVELKAKTDALWKLSEGKSYDFVEDATEAYSKSVPNGCRFAQVEKIGGKTVARNAGELVSAKVEDVKIGFPEQSGSIVTISDGIDGHALDITASWTPTQAGSGDPSPENIRAISGRTSVTVMRCGKNYINIKTLEKRTVSSCKYESTTDSGFRIICTTNGAFKPCLFYLPDYFIMGQTITISFDVKAKTGKATPGFRVIGYVDAYVQRAQLVELSNLMPGRRYSVKVTFPSMKPTNLDGYAVNFYATMDDAETEDYSEYDNVQIAIGAVESPYAPYSGTTRNLVLPETVYGGSVNATTGEGMKTWDYIVSYAGESLPGEWISDRDAYAAGTVPTIGAAVAYRLAEPVPFTAAGAKTITAKSGVNTVFSDAGNVKVKYSDDAYPIPDAVKALPGYGWGARNLCNEIVRRADGWGYIQRVGLPATTDGYTILDAPTTTDITDLMTGSLPLMATEPGGTITMHHTRADDGLTLDVPNTIRYIRDLKEVASSGTE